MTKNIESRIWWFVVLPAQFDRRLSKPESASASLLREHSAIGLHCTWFGCEAPV
jgi:hypothetical protein